MCNERAATLEAGAVYGIKGLAASLAMTKIITHPEEFNCNERLVALYYDEAASLLQCYRMPNMRVPVVHKTKPRCKSEIQSRIKEVARSNAYNQFLSVGWLIRDQSTKIVMISETAKQAMKI